VLDVGANLGVISIGMLVNGDVAAAIGVEPDPDNYALLERNIARTSAAIAIHPFVPRCRTRGRSRAGTEPTQSR